MYEVNFDRTEGRNSNKITVGDFDTPLSVTDRTTRQKISKETEGLDNGAVVVAVQLLSHVQLYDPMGCSPAAPSIHGILQANWSGLPFSFPGDLPKSGIKPMSSALADGFFTANPPGKHQIRSVAQSCPTLCDPMNRSTPGLPVHHQLLEFPETHIHRVSDTIQTSHPLSFPSPPAPNPSQHQSLFQ